jgi:hypothetical protein
MKINHIIHEAGTGLEIDRSIPGRTIARISGDLAHRIGSPTDKRLSDQHDDYTPWSGKVGASTRDDEEDTFDIDYTGDDGELKEQDPGLDEAVEDYAGTYSPEAIAIGKKFCDQYNITHDTDVQLAVELIDAYLDEFKWRNVPVDLNVIKSKVAKDFRDVYRGMGPGPSFRKKFQEQGMAEGAAGLPDPQNFDSDNDYYDALDAYGKPQAMDADYENMDETKEKIGNMDADAFDAALARMKKLAGAGPLRTVYDPARRVYKNVPHAVQPAQQPKKAR